MRIKYFTSVVCIASLLLFAACGGDEKEVKLNQTQETIEMGNKIEKVEDAKSLDPSWRKENVLVFHTLGDPGDMHPTNGNTAQRQEITLYTQVFLTNTDFQKLDLYPQLAAAKPEISADGLEYIYALKDYLKWDDGSPITAEDVAFSFKANVCPLVNNPQAKPYLESIKDIKVISPTKVVFVMRDNYIQNLYIMTDFPLMQRTYFDKENLLSNYTFDQFLDKKFVADKDAKLKAWAAEFNSPKYGHTPENIVGAGPYKIESWESGRTITLVKKKNHWTEGRPGLFENAFPDKIIYKINTDLNSTKLEFLNQVYDGTASIDIKTMLELKEDPKFVKHFNHKFMDTYNYTFIGMNTKPDGVKHSKIFTDAKTRRAMALLIPYNDINTIVNKNIYDRIATPVSKWKDDCNKDLKLIETNIEEAKKLLLEAGWKDSDGDQILDKMVDGKKLDFKFKINYMTTTPAWETTSKLIAENMRKANVIAELNGLEFGTFITGIVSHDFDMMISTVSGSAGPDDFKQLWHTESWITNGSNNVGFGNAKTDAIIEKLRIAPLGEERNKLSKELQQIIYDEQPCIFMFGQKRRVIMHKRFGNQEYYYEKPGVLLNNMKLISASPN